MLGKTWIKQAKLYVVGLLAVLISVTGAQELNESVTSTRIYGPDFEPEPAGIRRVAMA